jgi:hypothetical protein
MRLALPILLLTALPALAQSQPLPLPDKPYVDDRVQLCPLEPPRPVTIGPGPREETSRTPPPAVCQKPETPKPLPPKGTG